VQEIIKTQNWSQISSLRMELFADDLEVIIRCRYSCSSVEYAYVHKGKKQASMRQFDKGD
jgi:hypothetical protein